MTCTVTFIYPADQAVALRCRCAGASTRRAPAGEEDARKGPSGTPEVYRGQPRYLSFTMAFLLVQGSPADRMLRTVCGIPKDGLWRRDMFGHILQNLGHVSFASVKSDVIYLIPRDKGWALTVEDLTDPKFHYLRKIV
ncbi:hypothetical protein [Sorangium sp. So ce128]|uniref:hypothetical protein n=1 Tax=Sorangium sp. So ce128 TaxID=3133281 RepID=UPI003F641FBD